MAFHGYIEALQHYPGRPIRLAIQIPVRHEKELGRTEQPHTAIPHLNAGQSLQVVQKHPGSVSQAVAVGVFQHQNTVPLGWIKTQFPLGIGVILSHPQTPLRVISSGDRVANQRLAGKNLNRKPLRHSRKLLGRFPRLHRASGPLLAVFGRRKPVLPTKNRKGGKHKKSRNNCA